MGKVLCRCLLVVLCLVFVVSCSGDPEHVHTFDDGKVTTEATCSATGVKIYTCTTCGQTKTETIPIDSNSHSFSSTYNSDATNHWKECANTGCTAKTENTGHVWNEGETTKEPTCTETGIKTYACTTCSQTKTETIPIDPNSHSFSSTYNSDETNHWKECSLCHAKKDEASHTIVNHEAKAPTCTEVGWDAYKTCSSCDYTTYVEKSALDHLLTAHHQAKSVTCENVGWNAYDACEREGCSYTTKVEIPALGHDYAGTVTTVAATCSKEGSTTTKCTRCDSTKTESIPIDSNAHSFSSTYSSDATNHWKECTNTGCTAKTENTGHVWNEGETTKEPTCTETGIKTYACTTCSQTKTETISKKNHDWDTDNWTSDSTGHWHACKNTGCTEKKDSSGHTETTATTTEATCTTAGEKRTYCSVCNFIISTESIPAGHKFKEEWNNNETHHWHDCEGVGCSDKGSYAEHSWGEGAVTTPATSETVGVRTYTCVCGKTKTAEIPKTTSEDYDSNANGHWLKTESEANKAEHTYGDYTVTKAATCTATGEKTQICTVCGYVKTEPISMLEHDYSTVWTYDDTNHYHKCKNCTAKADVTAHTLSTTVTKVATCTETGSQTIKCSNCDYSKTESIKAKEHTWNDGVITTQPTCTETGLKTYTCTETGCGATKTETVVVLGHDLENHEAKAPTCTGIGWDAYDTCKRDGCNYSTYKEISALGHALVNHEAQAPTCTNIGWDAYDTCNRDGCTYTTYKEKAALGHDLVSHEAKAPTCTEIGWDSYDTCSRCDYTTKVEKAALDHSYSNAWTTDANNHWHKCIRCEAKSNEAPHNWDAGVTTYQESSCDGRKTYTCQTCSKTKDENVFLEHTYVNYRCSRCQIWGLGPSGGYVFYDCDADNEVEYTAEDGTTKKNKDGLTSATCGWRFLEAAPADITVDVDGTSTSTFIFGTYIPDGQTKAQPVEKTKDSVGAGKTNTEELVFAMGLKGENAWTESQSDNSSATTTKEYAALLCYNYKYTNTETNETFDDWFLPSIEELKLIMSNLNAQGLGTLHYDLRNYWSSTEDSSTSENKVKIMHTQGYKVDATETVLIKYGTNGQANLRPIRAFSLCTDGTTNHDWTVKTTAATCTERGNTIYTCSKCTAKKVEAIKELGHSWDEGEVTEPATCTNKGTKTYTCSNCLETRTEEIPIDPSYHPYENYKCKDCGIWGKGPSGGYVFYDCDADNASGNADGLTSSVCGWRFLEAAPSDAVVDIDGTSTSLFIFGCYAKELEASLSNAGTETGIGTGLANTEKLVKAMGRNALVYSNFTGAAGKSDTTANYAAKVALDYSVTNNGAKYNDWFLPSKEELETLISNIGLCKNKAGESVELDSSLHPVYNTLRWSSSEDTASTNTGALAYYVQLSSDFSSTNTFSRDTKYYVRPIRAFSLCSDGKSEHTWVEDTTKYKAETCTENGSKTYKCSVCGATKTETLVALGHEYENYKCTNCEAWGRGPAGGWVFYDAGSDQTTKYTDMNGNTKEYTWRYLEAAPEDCSYTQNSTTYYEYAFGYYRENATINPTSGSKENLTVGTGTDIGTGRNNTGLLLSKMGFGSQKSSAYVSLPEGKTQYSSGAYAAGATYCNINGTSYKVTNPRTGESYEDWFLPSKDELALMSQNLREKDLGNLRNGEVYWSSSEKDADNAYSVYFSSSLNDYTTPDFTARSTAFRVRPVRAFTDTETTTSN